MSTIILGGFKDNWEMITVYFKTNSISYTHLLTYVLLYHAVFHWSKTIGTRENEGHSHSMGKILFES